MEILLFGRDGQVGWELQRALSPLGNVVALNRNGAASLKPNSSARLCGDLLDLDGITATIRLLRPDVIVNAAAYNAVDRAESEPQLAHSVNAVAPGVLARGAASIGALLIHYSSDYVFDGAGVAPRDEQAVMAPLNTYGRTKVLGEEAIRESGCLHLIFRTSWVYAARGKNFTRMILRLATERKQLHVVNDQVGAPTGAELIADVTANALRALRFDQRLEGTYHLAAAGEVTWFDYANFIIDTAHAFGVPLSVMPKGICAISTLEYPTAARRPLNSRLSVKKVERTFNLCMPPWQLGVTRILDEWFNGSEMVGRDAP